MNAVMDHTTVTVWHKPSELIIMWYIIDLLSGNSISVCKGQGRPPSAGRAFSEWVSILSHLPRVFGQVLTNWSMHVCVLLCNVSETEVSFHPLRIPADPVQNGSFIHFFESVPGHIHTIHVRTVGGNQSAWRDAVRRCKFHTEKPRSRTQVLLAVRLRCHRPIHWILRLPHTLTCLYPGCTWNEPFITHLLSEHQGCQMKGRDTSARVTLWDERQVFSDF